MADEKTKSQRARGATPGKLALIGVLAVVLAVVMYVQFGANGGDDAPSPGASSDRPPRPPRSAATSAAGSPARSGATRPAGGSAAPADEAVELFVAAIDSKRWKSPELPEVVRYDPFALPATFPQPAIVVAPGTVAPGGVVGVAGDQADAERMANYIESLQEDLKALQQQGVRVIIDARKQAAAVIGDRTIHVGDEINGFTVTAIEPDGVRVEKKLDE